VVWRRRSGRRRPSNAGACYRGPRLSDSQRQRAVAFRDNIARGAIGGLSHVARNKTNPTKGMVAYTHPLYTTGWMPGDIKGAFLSDTDGTDLVGSGELVTNGDFGTDTDWTKGAGWTISGGVAVSDGTASNVISQAGILTVGKTYVVSFDIVSRSDGYVRPQLGTAIGTDVSAVGSYSQTVTSLGNGTFYIFSVSNFNGTIDNVSVKIADADRSVNAKGLVVNGTITRAPVATGADLVAYSGLSTANYLEQPYNAALDFGTGDFCVMGWVKNQQLYDTFFARSDGVTAGTEFVFQTGANAADMRLIFGGTQRIATGIFPTSGWWHLGFLRSSGVLYVYVNGIQKYTIADTTNVSQTGATLQIGIAKNVAITLGIDVFAGSIALLRISATAPTAQQIAKIYNDEKVLFQDGAQATLFGASDAVTALAHDPVTDLLHVGTSAGRSVFQGLRRVSNTTTAVGTAISAFNGLVVEE